MSTRKKAAQPPAVSTAPYWMWGGAVAAIAAQAAHLPGGILLWLALVIATFNAYPPELTGKGAMGEPTPANPYEEKLQQTYRAWKAMRGRLFGLNRSILPIPPTPGWIAAAALSASTLFLPSFRDLPGGLTIIGAICLFISLMALGEWSREKQSMPIDPAPQVTLTNVVTHMRTSGIGGKVAAVLLPVAAAGIAVIAWVVIEPLYPLIVTLPELGLMLSDPSQPLAPAAALWALAAFTATLSTVVKPGVYAQWHARAEARERWRTLFVSKLPKLTVPDLIDHAEHTGGITVDTFTVPGNQQREDYLNAVKQLGGAVGDGTGLFAATNLVDDGAGGKLESNTMFRYITVPRDGYPDLTDASTDPVVAGLVVEALVSSQMEWEGPALTDTTLLTTSDSPQPVWLFEFDGSRTSVDALRPSVKSLTSMLSAQVLIDKGMLSVGAMLAEDTVWDEEACGQPGDAMRAMYQQIADDDFWEKAWTDVFGSVEKTPTYRAESAVTATLPDGGEVKYAGFVIRMGLPPSMYYGMESKLATAIQNPAFTAIMPFPDMSASTRQRTVRHSQAIAVAWAPAQRSDGQLNRIPRTPQDLAPPRGRARQRGRTAQELILSGMVSRAFTASKLGQPLVTGAQALSDASARQHVWRVGIQLESNTYAEVLKKTANIRQDLGCPWMQMEPTEEGANLYIGTVPTQTLITAPKHWQKVVDLEWSGTWVTAKVTGSDGATPTLVSAEELPGNPDVTRAVFDLPQTLTIERIKSARAQLKAARGLAFLDIATMESPTQMEVTFSKKDPVPFPAPVDYEAMRETKGYAFGVGYDGLPRAFVPKRDVHMMMVGMSGTGKSVTIQMVMASALAKGTWVAVIDPSKGGVDFAFADDWLIAPRAGTLDEASATLQALYQEVQERKKIHAEYGVGSFTDLPEEARRPEVLVIIDEFTSLVMQEKLPPKSKDPSAQKARAEAEAKNAARSKIGNLVGRIFREARSVGFAVMLGTQKLDSKTLGMVPGGSDLKTNASRIILGNPALGELQSALRDPYNVPDIGDSCPQGRGRFESAVSGAELFQTWWAKQPELQGFLRDVGAPIPESTLDVESFMPREEAAPESEVDLDSGLLVLQSAPVEEAEIEEIEMDLEDMDLSEMLLDGQQDADEGSADGDGSSDSGGQAVEPEPVDEEDSSSRSEGDTKPVRDSQPVADEDTFVLADDLDTAAADDSDATGGTGQEATSQVDDGIEDFSSIDLTEAPSVEEPTVDFFSDFGFTEDTGSSVETDTGNGGEGDGFTGFDTLEPTKDAAPGRGDEFGDFTLDDSGPQSDGGSQFDDFETTPAPKKTRSKEDDAFGFGDF